MIYVRKVMLYVRKVNVKNELISINGIDHGIMLK